MAGNAVEPATMAKIADEATPPRAEPFDEVQGDEHSEEDRYGSDDDCDSDHYSMGCECDECWMNFKDEEDLDEYSKLTAAFTGPFRLMDLLPEVRRMIWKEVRAAGFDGGRAGERDSGAVFISDYGSMEFLGEQPEPVEAFDCSFTLHPLLFVSRQVYNEVASLLYDRVHFCIDFSDAMTMIEDPNLDLIKHLPWRLVTKVTLELLDHNYTSSPFTQIMEAMEWGKDLTALTVAFQSSQESDLDDFDIDELEECACPGHIAALKERQLAKERKSTLKAVRKIKAKCWVDYTFDYAGLEAWDATERKRLEKMGLANLVPEEKKAQPKAKATKKTKQHRH